MVTITGFVPRTRKDGTEFITLEITGGVEFVQSAETSRFYATVRKCSIPSTFDASIAKSIVGTQMPGNIVRVLVDPYDYINPRTGEMIKLQHSYAFQPEGSMELMGHTQVLQMA